MAASQRVIWGFLLRLEPPRAALFFAKCPASASQKMAGASPQKIGIQLPKEEANRIAEAFWDEWNFINRAERMSDERLGSQFGQ